MEEFQKRRHSSEQYSIASPARQRELVCAIHTAISRFPDWEQVAEDVASLL